jgi:hypothetical protein
VQDHSDAEKEGNMEQEICNRENGDAWLLVQPSWKCLARAVIKSEEISG